MTLDSSDSRSIYSNQRQSHPQVLTNAQQQQQSMIKTMLMQSPQNLYYDGNNGTTPSHQQLDNKRASNNQENTTTTIAPPHNSTDFQHFHQQMSSSHSSNWRSVVSTSEIKNNNQSDRAYSAAVKALRPKGVGGGQGIIIPKVSLKKKGGGQVNVQSLLGIKG